MFAIIPLRKFFKVRREFRLAYNKKTIGFLCQIASFGKRSNQYRAVKKWHEEIGEDDPVYKCMMCCRDLLKTRSARNSKWRKM